MRSLRVERADLAGLNVSESEGNWRLCLRRWKYPEHCQDPKCVVLGLIEEVEWR